MSRYYNRSNLIAAYSLTALSYLSIQQVTNAQVIYTDIEPDIDLDQAVETAGVDMDNDGIFEFGFLKYHGSVYQYPAGTFPERGIWVGPEFTENGIIADYLLLDNVYCSAHALNKLSLIGSSQSFFNYPYQVLAGVQYRFSSYTNIGFWFPNKLNHFIGVRFNDSVGLTHYGWIRCDVKHEGRELIIKDYAYDLTPDKAINAGDTISLADTTTLIPVIADAGKIKIYPNPANKSFRFTGGNDEVYTVNIYNIQGVLCFTGNARQTDAIDISILTAGVYQVEFINIDQRIYKSIIKI